MSPITAAIENSLIWLPNDLREECILAIKVRDTKISTKINRVTTQETRQILDIKIVIKTRAICYY
jgi:hypothetical protein